MTIIIYVYHLSIAEEALEKILRPLSLPLSFYRSFGWKTVAHVVALRICKIWFIGGAIYSVIITPSLIISGHIEDWYAKFGLTTFLPGNILLLVYLGNGISESDYSGPEMSELRENHAILDKILRKLEHITLSVADRFGIATRQNAARIISYYCCIISLLLLIAPFEFILPQPIFWTISLPILCCIGILLYGGLRNSVRHLRKIGHNYVRRSRGELIEESSTNDFGFEKSQIFRSFRQFFKNIALGYFIFLLGILLTNQLPPGLITALDRVVRGISEPIIQVISVISGLPAIAVISIFEILSQYPHPDELLFSSVQFIELLYI